MVSKGITLLVHTYTFNEDIKEWRRQTTDLNTWATFKTFFHQAHCKQRREVNTAVKGEYTVAVQNIYDLSSPPSEENYKAIDNLKTIFQGI